MKRLAFTTLFMFVSAFSSAQEQMRTIAIEPVTVTAPRILRNIGVQQTVLDTFSLRDNVTGTLADVLSQNSPIFIKSYGRGTLATASFRGTAPSHTQVMWNGMKLNSPMLGMVDFSQIPSYFVDNANLYHGASSVGVSSGGLGGAVVLGTGPAMQEKGLGLRYIQGISSYNTFDQFLRVIYGNGRLQGSTRVYYVSSENDFKYTNYRKKIYNTDETGAITGFSYPVERNRNGGFKDLHILQELYYDRGGKSRWSLSAWYMDSKRGVPMLNVDYKDDSRSKNEQDERTFRAVAGWDRLSGSLKLAAKAGYSYTDMKYTYLGDLGDGSPLIEMIHSQSYVSTFFGRFDAEYLLGDKWMFIANLSAHQHFVKSMDRAMVSNDGNKITIGYDKARMELSGFVSAKYRPTQRLGLAVNLRRDIYGDSSTPFIPAAFADYLISKRGNVVLKASVARNYRYPTLNDLYFMPGGNDTLKTEHGYTYDAGVAFALKNRRLGFSGEVTAFNSRINDWIVWLPTFKGFWSPVNVKKVHSYGLEFKGRLTVDMARDWKMVLDGNYAITHSINHGDPANWADEAIGKQLVYIPVYSGAVTGKLMWKAWTLTYKWNHYSERFTTSSNETGTKIGILSPYYMNDVSLERRVDMNWGEVSLKVAVNNLLGEEYESVLSRPMAGRNFGLFIEVTPKIKKRKLYL